ncbi:hypothetical protein [Oceaniglobus indicus]|uniref:hypothetical protein n=1 Tax=Oceaniglobus indicus TaxID=2047749 RepID=UPI000C19AFCA|nr:hypothetical protein [Oceaniglobus indicus]
MPTLTFRRYHPVLAVIAASFILAGCQDKVGKTDYGGHTPQDISFAPAYENFTACGIRVPVDKNRWSKTVKTGTGSFPDHTVSYRASEKLGSYKRQVDKLFKNHMVDVSYGCGDTIAKPDRMLAEFQKGFKGGDNGRVEWQPAKTLQHATLGTVHYAPYATVYDDGSRASGVYAYWSKDGSLYTMTTRIVEHNKSKYLARKQSWNTGFSLDLLSRITPL